MRLLYAPVLLAALASTLVQAQTTALDGVYTSAQAQRGSRTYARICAECHEGGEPDADPLFGGEFIDRWREAPLAFLYGFYSKEMPADEPGTLGTPVYQDVMAYLLQENGYPAGSKEIKAELMDDILLVGPSGPAALPPSALVKLVGCLQPDGSNWQLTGAATPMRVRTADETDDDEIAASTTMATGHATYTLQKADAFAPAALQGKRVQAKGVFNTGSLGVMSLVAAGDGC
jgi:mono/diheme cytochrome c family protein